MAGDLSHMLATMTVDVIFFGYRFIIDCTDLQVFHRAEPGDRCSAVGRPGRTSESQSNYTGKEGEWLHDCSENVL